MENKKAMSDTTAVILMILLIFASIMLIITVEWYLLDSIFHPKPFVENITVEECWNELFGGER